jgi:hypothetical protein
MLRILVLIGAAGNLLGVFAQETTVRSGFAVVTVTSGNAAGLIATANLRNNDSTGIEHSVVAPSPLIISGSLLVNVQPELNNTTALAIANPSLGSGAVNLILTDPAGTVVLNTTIPLGPRAHFSRFIHDLFSTLPSGLPSPLLLTVSSEVPVAVLALNFQGTDFSSVPLTSLSTAIPVPVQTLTPVAPVATVASTSMTNFTVSAVGVQSAQQSDQTISIGGGNAVVFPQVTTGDDWATDISIANTSTQTDVIRIDFFNADGTNGASFPDITIQPRGVFFFSTESSVSIQ